MSRTRRFLIQKPLFVSFIFLLLFAGLIVSRLSGHLGKKLFLDRCSRCHSVLRPLHLEQTEIGWKNTLFRMESKEPELFNAWEKAVTTQYLLDARSLDGKELFRRKCSRCHSLETAGKRASTRDWAWQVDWCRSRNPFWIGVDESKEIIDYAHSRLFRARDIVECIECHLIKAEGLSQEDARKGALPYLSPAKSETGGLLKAKCLRCHTARTIQDDRPVKEWTAIVRRMAEKSPSWIAREEERRILEEIRSVTAIRTPAGVEP